jgi:uncharacterized protein with GYD domain
MAKFLFQASYTAEGLKGLAKDTASGRKAAITKAAEALGGKLETVYYAFGADDVILIFDFTDNATAAALALAIAASGLVSVRTTPLLTVEEVDKALKKGVDYKAPGR